jgi:hypothetical protein
MPRTRSIKRPRFWESSQSDDDIDTKDVTTPDDRRNSGGPSGRKYENTKSDSQSSHEGYIPRGSHDEYNA